MYANFRRVIHVEIEAVHLLRPSLLSPDKYLVQLPDYGWVAGTIPIKELAELIFPSKIQEWED